MSKLSDLVANVPEANKREGWVHLAKLAEQSERYDDMVVFCQGIVDVSGGILVQEERNLFSVAYKNVVGIQRSAYRAISSLEQRGSSSEAKKEKIEAYLDLIRSDLKRLCTDVIGILDNTLIERAADDQSKVFYLKMKGDYYRYLTECAKLEERDVLKKDSQDAYKEAMEVAQQKMESKHPIRLGLALNFSVFYYEIMNDPQKACELAENAFKEAITELDSSQEDSDSYKDSALIMQLLRDNLTLWRPDLSEHDDDQQVQ